MAATDVAFVGDRQIVLTFRDGDLTEGGMERYRPAGGDSVFGAGVVWRNGRPYGKLQDDGDRSIWVFDSYSRTRESDFFTASGRGDGRNFANGDLPQSYAVTAGGDRIAVVDVHRKSMVVNTAETTLSEVKPIIEHTVTLTLARPLGSGQRVSVAFPGDNDMPAVASTYGRDAETPAIQLSQIGFDAEFGMKAAYVAFWYGRDNADSTTWRGEYDALDGLAGRGFTVEHAATGAVAVRGTLTRSPHAPSVDRLSDIPVFEADFSELSRPGTYRVVVEGLGASPEFEVASDIWSDAFYTAARAFYHQRSGIALTSAHTEWTRPRALHPDDGIIEIYNTTATMMDTSMGLNLRGQNTFQAVRQGATRQVVDDAWGGWHDAGDFDRRIQHLEGARSLMRLVELKPDFARRTDLDIPESNNGIPDILDEALWGLDVFMRLQKPNGGVPGGIEGTSHPTQGHASWTDPMTLYVMAPDAWSSYEFAATAARAAHLLQRYAPGQAGDYLDAAERAYAWARANTPGYAANNVDVRDAHTLAAAELFRATGRATYNEDFLRTSVYWNGSGGRAKQDVESGLTYYLADHPSKNQSAANAAVSSILSRADRLISEAGGAFGELDKGGNAYSYANTAATPRVSADFLVAAHAVSGQERYLDALVSDTFYGLGANPMGLSHVTGVGWNSPERIWHRDTLIAGGEPPPGITVFGGVDPSKLGNDVWRREIDKWIGPDSLADRPVHEMYQSWDFQLSEYSVRTMDATALVWGYLAAVSQEGWSQPRTDAPASGGQSVPVTDSGNSSTGGGSSGGGGGSVVAASGAAERHDAGGGAHVFVFDSLADSTRAREDRIVNFGADDSLDLAGIPFARIVTDVVSFNADPASLLLRDMGREVVLNHGGWGWDAFQLRIEGSAADVLDALM